MKIIILVNIIKILSEKILLNGGGHNIAAGFTLKKKIRNFKNLLNNRLFKENSTNIYLYDAKISTYALNKDFYKSY